MKKRFIILSLLFLLLPIVVNAEESNDVKITNMELIEKSKDTKEINAPTFSLNKANFNIKFSKVGDYAKYKVTIKNESQKEYKITSETRFADHEHMKYEFSHENDSKIIHPGDTATMYVSFSYNKEVPSDKFVNGKYVTENSMLIELVDDTVVVTVPDTALGHSKTNIIAIILITIAFLVTLFIYKKGNSKTFVIILSLLLLLPFAVYAAQKITLLFESRIEVNSFSGTIYRWNSVYLANKGTYSSATVESQAESTTLLSIASLKKGSDYITEEDYPTFSSRAATLGKNYYLKHDIVDNRVINSYVCFIYNNAEHCMKGGDYQTTGPNDIAPSISPSLAENSQIIGEYQAFYGLNTIVSPSESNPGCNISSSGSSACFGGGFYKVAAMKNSGGVEVWGSSKEFCTVDIFGTSYCQS